MTTINGTFETSRSFRQVFGDAFIANFTYYPNIHALVVNGKGLFVCHFQINDFGQLSFLFLYNDTIATIKNGRLVNTEREYYVFCPYLKLLYDTKAAHLSAICKLWNF